MNRCQICFPEHTISAPNTLTLEAHSRFVRTVSVLYSWSRSICVVAVLFHLHNVTTVMSNKLFNLVQFGPPPLARRAEDIRANLQQINRAVTYSLHTWFLLPQSNCFWLLVRLAQYIIVRKLSNATRSKEEATFVWRLTQPPQFPPQCPPFYP